MVGSGSTQLIKRNLVRAWRRASTAVGAPWSHPAPWASGLAGSGASEIHDFGSNPGRLRMLVHVPAVAPAPGMPLVVVLHGCSQSASQFATESGWIGLSERLGLTLVLPEQSGANNRQGCFNWFRPGDITRGRGEALSIRQMVAEALRRFRADRRQVFVVGLSAGGAMAAALCAAYPDVFSAGAVVAGMPVGCARTPSQAFTCMSDGGPERTPLEWAARARSVGPARFGKSWPRISIWQGAQDRIVDPRNAENLVAQWTALHGFELGAGEVGTPLPGVTRSVWGSRPPVVEYWQVPALAHAFPVAQAAAPAANPAGELDRLLEPWGALVAFGHSLPHGGSQQARWIDDVGVDAATEIARFWAIA